MLNSTINNYGKVAGCCMLVFLAAFMPSAANAATSGALPRQHLRLDDNWRFAIDRSPTPRTAFGTPVTSWRYTPVSDASLTLNSHRRASPNLDSSPNWAPVTVGTDVFQGRIGFAWFQAQLPGKAALTAGARRVLHFEGIDDNAAVFLNGKLLKRHSGYGDPFDVDLTTGWQSGGPNTLTVLVENTAGAGGIMQPVFLEIKPVHPMIVSLAPAPVPAEAKPAFNASAWRVVHLPHDYVVEQAFTPTADPGHGSLPTPPAWYRRTFDLPASDRGKAVDLQFDGVYRDAKVYLNGVLVGEHPSGYTGFHYDISRAAKYGARNTLAVHVNPSKYEGWFYEGGGIYRHVWLNIAQPVHIADDGGVYVTTQMPEPKALSAPHPATVIIKTSFCRSADCTTEP